MTVLADLWLGATLYLSFTAVVSMLGVGTVWVGWKWLRSPAVRAAGVLLVLVLGLVALRFSSLNPAKPFRAFYLGLEEFMTESEVRSLLNRRFPKAGRFPAPSIGRIDPDALSFTLDRNRAEYDSEIVQVVFEGGYLKRAYYLLD